MSFPEIKRVSIIGAGWLGLPLISKLIENGFEVKASTGTKSKIAIIEQLGAKGYYLRFDPTCNDTEGLIDLLDTDVVIICMAPRFSQHKMMTFHAEQIKGIRDEIEKLPVNKVIYTSSTSVYKDVNAIVNENAASSDSPRSRSVILAEEVLRINTDLDATILRCGGLMGYDRIPAKYVDGKKDLITGDIPVNYVFRDDVIRAIMKVLEINDHNSWNKVFNLVAPEHPPKRIVYEATAKYGNYIVPTFISPASAPPFKIVDSQKIQDKISFTFLYENPTDFIYDEMK
ncbi:NAD(P)H-binding protein [Flammeovirga sp. EKP202]|uniref:NAD(P)H-binding protein n=1 Tax=Flammeovirga sp. EKP202 TaxID=2770592 RepID=UPI00165FD3CA|nr:NAD(P)H-binding protein [Flammeovirga sp. EKP202]MBD0401895.1 NAD(P)H-binding protein [Flammeovirga sp. EKP202]